MATIKKFGDISSKFDGMGDYITIPDTEFYFNINDFDDYEYWSWVDKDGNFHFEIKVSPPITAWSRFVEKWRGFTSRVVNYFKSMSP